MREKIKSHIFMLWAQLNKGIFQMLSANVLNKGVAMLTNMTITRLLSKFEYGMWSYVINIYSYLSLVSGLGLLAGAFQFGAENKNKKEEFQYYKYCLKIGIAIDGVLVSSFFIGTFFVDFALANARNYLRIYVPILLLEYVLNLLLVILRCENRIPEYAKILNINTVLNAVGTCVGAVFGISGVIIGKYIAIILSTLQILYRTRNESKQIRKADNLTLSQQKTLWHYSVFVGSSSAMNSLLYLLDVSMIAEFVRNPVDIADYKVATLIPIALGFIPQSVVTAVLPNIIQHRNERIWLRKEIKKIFLYMALANGVICIGLYLLAPWIICLVSGSQYLSAVPIFRILLIEYFISGTFRVLSANVLAGLRYVNYGFFVSISSAISDIALNINLIQRYGIIGAAYATLGSMIVAGVLASVYLYYVVFWKKERKNLSQ